MADIESKVKITEEDVEYIRNLESIFEVFDFSPWDVFETVEDLNGVTFKYERKKN